jgi:murein DD-endopeptidase MepM/ murein hydrolase activator NlpD
MIDKTMGVRSMQVIDQSLISIGGWLRNIDAQVISFIRSDHKAWIGQSFYFPQHAQASDIPEWTYQNNAIALHKNAGKQSQKWYQYFGLSSALWHTSLDWRSPLPGFGLNPPWGASQTAGLALSYAYASPAQRLLGRSAGLTAAPQQYPFSTTEHSEGLSQFWSTSYQLSTALAVLLPIAVNTAQSPVLVDFVDQVSDVVTLATDNKTTLKPSSPKVGEATVNKTPVQALRPLNKPTGRIANIQSYVLPTKGEFTSGYGMRWGRIHRGIDIAGPIGTPIIAAAAGKVITAGWSEDGFGNKVEIQHPDGTITLYAHTSRVLTRVGVRVQQGQQIAEMGSSGFSTGSHLHFQIHPGGKTAVDPMFFFGKNKTLTAAKPDV